MHVPKTPSTRKQSREADAPETSMKPVFPNLPYLPQDPKEYSPEIGMIGCGGITKHHLQAYKAAGYRVSAFCDIREENALARRKEFYPEAAVFTDYRKLLEL